MCIFCFDAPARTETHTYRHTLSLHDALPIQRLAPEPRLIPADLDDRTLMFGLCNALCSENGFGWNLRLKTTHRMPNDPNGSDMAKAISPVLARRYHYEDRTRGVQGKSVSVSVDLGGRSIIKKKQSKENE